MKNKLKIIALFLLPSTSFAFTFDNEVPKNIQDQMRSDLDFVKTIKSNSQSDLHKEIFGEVSGETYSQFFESRVSAVGLNGCGNSNAVACVIPFMDPSKMWLTNNYIKFSHPQIARLMIVFHESRHTESQNENWQHARCPQPFLDASGQDMKSIWTGASLAGEPACDTTPYGSYGSSLIMLKNVSKYCVNCSEKVKMDAGIYADNQFTRITDSEARSKIQQDLFN